MLKHYELSSPKSCLNKARTDEPVFVLRAKDPVAAMTIRHWATMSEDLQGKAKLQDALALADAMETWRKQNCPEPPKQVDPQG